VVRNLAGSKEADAWCASELTAAKIEIVMLPEPQRDEVSTCVTGKIGDVTLTRAWYYWRAHGRVPAEVARRLYDHLIGRKDVRVNGHCGCPAPGEPGGRFEWFNADGRKVAIDPDGSEEASYAHYVAKGVLAASDAPLFAKSTDGLTGYITSYHIDSAEGLELFAREVKAGSKGD
jgi:hypothetical protein